MVDLRTISVWITVPTPALLESGFPTCYKATMMFRTSKLQHSRSIAAGPMSLLSWWTSSRFNLSLSDVNQYGVFYFCIAF